MRSTSAFPVTLIGEAVFARCLSAMKDERIVASKALPGPSGRFPGARKEIVEDIRKALYASKIVSYAQGYMLMREAAKEYHWNLNYGGIALMWRGGCIIRSAFLGKIKEAFDRQPEPHEPAAGPLFPERRSRAARTRGGGPPRRSIEGGIPIPAFSTALSFYDGYRCGRSRPTCFRHSVTFSALTPMRGSTRPGENSSTRTGQEKEWMLHQGNTMPDNVRRAMKGCA